MAEIEVSGGGCTIRVSGLPESTDKPEDWGLWIRSVGSNWMDMHAKVHAARLEEIRVGMEPKVPIQGGSAGFVVEQADEWRNGKLPGGDAARRDEFGFGTTARDLYASET